MHWLAKAIEILQADTLDLRTLAILAGGNPTVFYRGADLTNADLRGQDLRDMSFKGAILEGVLIDSETLMDPALIAQLYRQETRVALVIGNAAYECVEPLAKSVKDAVDVAGALKRLGFEVAEYYDLREEQMRRVLGDFEDKVRDADWALVYYSGHAMELNGENWLIPVNAALTHRADLLDQAVPLDKVLERLSGARKLRIAILDAQIAAIEPARGDIVFCAAGQRTRAYAGKDEDRNSFFTEALLRYMGEEGLELGQFFRKVTNRVIEAFKAMDPTGTITQEPCVYGSIPDEDFYFNPPLDYKAVPYLDYKELSRLVAKDLGGTVSAEVEAEVRLGKGRGWSWDAATVSELLVSLAQLAIQIAEANEPPDELSAALEAKAASADKIDKEKRKEIINLIVDQLNRSK